MDWLAVVSTGTYPTPTPTDSERAAYAVSYGLLGTLYEEEITVDRGLLGIGMATTLK